MKYFVSILLRIVPRRVLQLFSDRVLKLIAPLYYGKSHFCPIEGRSYRRFLPYGRVHSRPNVLCPGSLSLERHRLLWLYLSERTDFFEKSQKMLHIAPEVCFMRAFEAQHGEGYVTADLESPLAKVKMDVHAIPFEEGTFDIAMCNHVMEHVTDDLKAMGEIYRVLKPNGWAIIQVPFYFPIRDVTYEDDTITTPSGRQKAFGQDDHVRMYGKDYVNRLAMAGFSVIADDFIHSLSSYEVERMRLPKNELIYFCRKKKDSRMRE